ncbi:MAG TPA: methyltransferase domain-containing protein [Actinospica sp.]|nr:methyltransferase domain-containing protein [Actinospica sp.]
MDLDLADAFHAAAAGRGLSHRLHAEAFGEEYPAEVDPSSSCTWTVLGEMVRRLRLRPDALLVDLGCGRGGTGLWLARALSARLVGIDISPKAVELATERIPEFFPAQAADRARFQVGTFAETGLPDECADGLVVMDALSFGPDRDASLRELRRILKPGARAVFTGGRNNPGHPMYRPGRPTWEESIAAAGLELEAKVPRPEERGLWDRLNDLWESHEEELRREDGDLPTDAKLTEARNHRPGRPYRDTWIFTARKPPVDA